jgi:DNA-binding PadR family transcriptional regulator
MGRGRQGLGGARFPFFEVFRFRGGGAVSSIDLVLLGLLSRQEKSAYDLAREIEHYDLDSMIRLSIPAVYKNVKQLEGRGYLEHRETKRGEMPEKTLYTLTESGREYFFILMERYAAEKVRYRFDFNSVIINIDKVPRKRREKLLLRLKEQLAAGRRDTESSLRAWSEKSASADLMLRQVELVSRALREWIDAALDKL